jgi:hypothetical protein
MIQLFLGYEKKERKSYLYIVPSAREGFSMLISPCIAVRVKGIDYVPMQTHIPFVLNLVTSKFIYHLKSSMGFW